jgi:hypothetical protein
MIKDMTLEIKIFVGWIILFALSYITARLDYAKNGYPISFKYYTSPFVGIFYILKYFGIAIWCLFFVVEIIYYFLTNSWIKIF